MSRSQLTEIEYRIDEHFNWEVREHSTYRATFEIARVLKSQNTLKGNTKHGRFAYQDERAWWHKQFATAVMAGWVTVAKGYRVVRVTRVLGKGAKLFDIGNLVGGCKAMIDAMVNVGVLVDDSPKHCFITYRQVRGEHDAVKFEVWE